MKKIISVLAIIGMAAGVFSKFYLDSSIPNSVAAGVFSAIIAAFVWAAIDAGNVSPNPSEVEEVK